MSKCWPLQMPPTPKPLLRDSSTTTINGVTYFNVEAVPPPPVVNTVTTANTDNLITQFVSQLQPEQVVFPSGLWAFRVWLQASHSNCTLAIAVSRLDINTATKTLIRTAGADHTGEPRAWTCSAARPRAGAP
jgi:hypothetical protein